MNEYECPKYQSCNAPICPLDSNVLKRKYLKGEAVCFFVSEYVKDGSIDKFSKYGAIGEYLFEVIHSLIEPMKCTYGTLKKRLERSSKTPSRMDGKVFEKV